MRFVVHLDEHLQDGNRVVSAGVVVVVEIDDAHDTHSSTKRIVWCGCSVMLSCAMRDGARCPYDPRWEHDYAV